jgi:hypothetical protein
MDLYPEKQLTEAAGSTPTLTYKHERVREKLREAITGGEWKKKLPGERILAKLFDANAKTVSKALTELAAEGLLDRGVGSGTYVKGKAPNAFTGDHWLLICDPGQTDSRIERLLRAAHPDLEVVVDIHSVRPKLLKQVSSVVVLAASVSDSFIFDLIVRQLTVMLIGTEARTFSTHAILFDRKQAISRAVRDLMLSGHRKLAAVGHPGSSDIVKDLRHAAIECAPDQTIELCTVNNVAASVSRGVTGFVCDSTETALAVKNELANFDLFVPGQASVTGVGTSGDDQIISGYFIHCSEIANAAIRLLNSKVGHPTTLWLPGRFIDRGTTGPPPLVPHILQAA